MKNRLLKEIILVVTFGLIISIIGCATGKNIANNPSITLTTSIIEGTWKNATPKRYESTFIFKGNTMLFTQTNGTSRPGTFTFTNTKFSFIPRHSNTWTGYSMKYKLTEEDGKLILTFIGDEKYGPLGPFYKLQQ
ncbi:MAG: hypothetical protein LBE13_12955 [Bacteroidales bacterium]|nr:hypothetical protein [Bacteroidales bacterium]